MTSPPLPLDRLTSLAQAAAGVVVEAGKIALGFAEKGARSWLKNDASHVTEADLAVDTFLKTHLPPLLPEAGWLSEESLDSPERLNRTMLWVVDPIDGTRSFMQNVPVWVISVALVAEGTPVLGIIYNPSRNEMFEAQAGNGARLNGEPLHISPCTMLEGASVGGPVHMVEHLTKHHNMLAAEWIHALAYRFANVAAGTMDLALSRGNAKDWDIAAADILLREAGGRLVDFEGRPPLYNQPVPAHPPLAAFSNSLAPALRAPLFTLPPAPSKR